MSSGMDIAKAGWLHRQSSVLRRWKKNWFVLYQDGVLRYFESEDSPRAEEVFALRSCCSHIKTGPEVQSVSPPDGVSSGTACMLEMVMRDGGSMVLCAESLDDMKAWQYALEEARTMAGPGGAVASYTRQVPLNYEYHAPYMGYGGYPGQIISPPPGAQVIHSADGRTTIIHPGGASQVVYMDDYPYRRRRYGYGYGAGTGFLAGAMVGSALMWPWFWF